MVGLGAQTGALPPRPVIFLRGLRIIYIQKYVPRYVAPEGTENNLLVNTLDISKHKHCRNGREGAMGRALSRVRTPGFYSAPSSMSGDHTNLLWNLIFFGSTEG